MRIYFFLVLYFLPPLHFINCLASFLAFFLLFFLTSCLLFLTEIFCVETYMELFCVRVSFARLEHRWMLWDASDHSCMNKNFCRKLLKIGC